MKAEFVNPFLEATAVVFKDMLGVELIRGKTSIKQSPAPAQDIAIMLGVTGVVSGQIVYSVNIDTVYKIVQKLMPGVDDETIQEEYRDVMGELANMITGNALNIFLKQHSDLDVTVPMVVDIRSQEVSFKSNVTLGLNMYSQYGMLEVNIALS